MKSYKRIIVILFILAITLSIIFITKKPAIGYTVYDKDGKLLEDINYNAKDVNVILVVFNTLRAKNVGIYGYERDTTPNIDNFSKEGVLFKQAYAPWTKTTPSLVSILTGQYPHTTGIVRFSAQTFPENLTSIAEILKQNDYKTFGIASNPNTGPAFNFDQGFDEFIDVVPEKKKFTLGDNSKHTKKETDIAMDLLTKNKDEKFFLYLHYLDPHTPYTAPEPYKSKYIEDEYFHKYKKKLPVTDKSALGIIPTAASNIEGATSVYVDYYISQYDAEVNYIDFNLKRLLDKIKELNLDKNTLIILMSDHGSSLGEHDYWFEHGIFAYDACAHVPLIISYPKLLPKNKVIDEPLNTINIVPTILNILNIPIGKHMEGKSLLPLILKNKKVDEYVYGAGGYNEFYITTIRDKKWKLIKSGRYIINETTTKVNTTYYKIYDKHMAMSQVSGFRTSNFSIKNIVWPILELYDIENDPDEIINLIDKEQEITDKLLTKMFEFLNKTKTYNITDIQRPPLDEETVKRLQALGYLT